jgi:hypothetical protein
MNLGFAKGLVKQLLPDICKDLTHGIESSGYVFVLTGGNIIRLPAKVFGQKMADVETEDVLIMETFEVLSDLMAGKLPGDKPTVKEEGE